MVPLSTGELAVAGLGIVAPGVSGPGDALAPAAAADPGWFHAEVSLPGRGYRRLPIACKYLLAASRLAIADAGDRLLETGPDHRATVVATNNAGAALLDELDYTIIHQGAGEMPPSSTPFMVMSLFASRLSMEHGITGFNLTVNSPMTAGLEAIQIASRAVAAGRASTVLVGAVEETLSPSQSAGPGSQAGAAVLYCEPTMTGPAHYGTFRARNAFLDPAAAGGHAAAAVFAALVGSDPPGRIDAVLDDSAVGAAAGQWLNRMAGERDIVVVPAAAGTGCLTPVRRVVGLFAQEYAACTRCAVLATSAQGTLAFAELTVAPRPVAATRGADSKEEVDVRSP